MRRKKASPSRGAGDVGSGQCSANTSLDYIPATRPASQVNGSFGESADSDRYTSRVLQGSLKDSSKSDQRGYYAAPAISQSEPEPEETETCRTRLAVVSRTVTASGCVVLKLGRR